MLNHACPVSYLWASRNWNTKFKKSICDNAHYIPTPLDFKKVNV